MKGAWAREADAVIIVTACELERAALILSSLLLKETLNVSLERQRKSELIRASAIIRRNRLKLDPRWMVKRSPDWGNDVSDRGLIWGALKNISEVENAHYDEYKTWLLREAESALRTLHKRDRNRS